MRRRSHARDLAVSGRDGSFAFSLCTLKRESKATFSPCFMVLFEKEQADASWRVCCSTSMARDAGEILLKKYF